MEAFPPIRHLDAMPVKHEGKTFVCLMDPSGYVEDQLMLSPAAYFVSTLLDGCRDLVEIQEVFATQFEGAIVPKEDITGIVNTLGEQGFLLNDRFERIRIGIESGFLNSAVRPAHLSGKSYASDPVELRKFLDSFFTCEGGPGKPLAPPRNGMQPLHGIIVPHIDFQRGGHCYAHGYGQLFASGKPRTAIIFGVAHAAAPVPFILTKKDFETPFGTVKIDTEVVEELEQACTWDPYEHEVIHRTEHSIEFQAVMLAYLYGTDVRIVPILCSMFSSDPGMSKPGELTEIRRFLGACRRVTAPPKERVTIIAGADLAHVGKRFGDPFDIDDAIILSVSQRDHEDLAFVTDCNPEAFYASVMKDQNKRKVCGLGCIYSTLETLRGIASNAEMLHYDYAHDPAGGIVSFASVYFA